VNSWKIENDALSCNGIELFRQIDNRLSIEPDALNLGCYIHIDPKDDQYVLYADLGTLPSLTRLTALHAGVDPFWMVPAVCPDLQSVPVNTQWMLCELSDNRLLMVTGLYDDRMQYMLQGSEKGALQLAGATNDAFTRGSGGLAAYMFVVDKADYYKTLPLAAKTLSDYLGTGKLRIEKRTPAFIDHFAWCTWDAFYTGVSEELVKDGLDSFKQIGITPKALILDDGWQQLEQDDCGQKRLVGFGANEKFPNGLSGFKQMIQRDYGVDTLIVWHAVNGYWGGVNKEELPGYRCQEVIPRGSDVDARVLQSWQGSRCAVVHPQKARKFYDDYHSALSAEGVDGVKVDNQNSLLYLADRLGGRVQMFKAFRKAMERTSKKYFNNTFINCMSHAPETWYNATDTNVNRTSTDFWPRKPRSHVFHLYTNAHVSAWFGNFMEVDWDMFQSGHDMGEFHAVGRAVSGGPVYVSDKPGMHNADALRKLICSDGRILRALDPGKPTLDSLFIDSQEGDDLMKLFNRNAHGYVLGIFNGRYRPDLEGGVLKGAYRVSDVDDTPAGEYVAYRHYAQDLQLVDKEAEMTIELGDGSAEVVTICPVVNGMSVIGLLDKYNSSGAISKLTTLKKSTKFTICDGGTVGIWKQDAPQAVEVDGGAVDYDWNEATGLLTIQVQPGSHQVRIM